MASKNTPTAIMSGAGWLMQFGSGVSNGLLARGYDNDRIHALVTDGGKADMERGINAFVAAIAGPSVPTFDPATSTFRWEVNYDETIAAKTAVKDPNSLAWATAYATDEKFPDNRTGKRIVTGRIWFPNRYMKQDAVEHEAPGILARPKELIDFSRAFPHPALDTDMPLAAPGRFWADAGGRRCLCLRRGGAGRGLLDVWLHPAGEWDGYWRFLVLDK